MDNCIVKAVNYHSSYLLAEVEADITVMKECQLKANSVSSSVYAKRFKETIERLQKNLKAMIKFFSQWKAL